MIVSRRNALLSTLSGAGYVGLRALATGLPVSLLLNPRRALAAAPAAGCAAQNFVAGAFDALAAYTVGLVIIKAFEVFVIALLGLAHITEHVRGQRAKRVLTHRRDDQVRAGQGAGALLKRRDLFLVHVAPHG